MGRKKIAPLYFGVGQWTWAEFMMSYDPKYMSVVDLNINDANPRNIDDVKFAKLVKSVNI